MRWLSRRQRAPRGAGLSRGWLLAGGGLIVTAIVPAPGSGDTLQIADVEQAARHRLAPIGSPPFTPQPTENTAPLAAISRIPHARGRITSLHAPAVSFMEPNPVLALQGDKPLLGPAEAIRFELPPPGDLPDLARSAALAAADTPIVVTARTPIARTSPAEIEQISTPAQGREAMPQLVRTRVQSAALLADAAAAMQVALPPAPAFDGEERSALLAGAPDKLTVRIDGVAVGKVGVAITDTRAVAVQLGDLLDIVAARMAPDRYEQLRQSPATASLVTLDRLREAGISMRYDAAYDELLLTV